MTMQQAASALGVSDAVVRRLIAQKTLPAKQIVKFAPWMIERQHLELPAVHRADSPGSHGPTRSIAHTEQCVLITVSNPEEQLGEDR